MDTTSRDPHPEQLDLLDPDGDILYSDDCTQESDSDFYSFQEPAPKPKNAVRPRTKLLVNLGILGPRLREHAQRLRTSMAAVIRKALRRLLDEEAPSKPCIDCEPFEHSPDNVQYHLYMPAACAAEMTARARAADMTRGEFVWSLLKGISPPALCPDHVQAVQTLMRSSNHLAAISTDLREYVRLLSAETICKDEIRIYRDSIASLDEHVRQHLQVASALVEDLKPFRKLRW